MAHPSSSTSKAYQVKCCDTCGSDRAQDALITCSGCKDSHQHSYCTRIWPLEHPKKWLCEDCDPTGKDKALKKPIDVFPNLRRLNHVSGLKYGNAGKTKLISDKDAIHLATIKRVRPFASRTSIAVSRGVGIQQVPVKVRQTKTPSAEASWSGSFRVFSDSQQFPDLHILQARPPSIVHKKVYEFSKSMPSVLEAKLIPRSRVWMDVDQHLCGDSRDIGLYFFPIKKKRWDSYDSLLELMETKDYAMRARLVGVDLLIFTSRVLRINCQEWRGRIFLWGLFRKVKRNAPPLDAPPPKRKASEHCIPK